MLFVWQISIAHKSYLRTICPDMGEQDQISLAPPFFKCILGTVSSLDSLLYNGAIFPHETTENS